MTNHFDTRITSNQYQTLNGPLIGEGLQILTMLGAAYGGYKWYKYHKARVAVKE
jgi:hypothetical protein